MPPRQARPTKLEQEFLMSTAGIVEDPFYALGMRYVEQGIELGFARAVRAVYQARFGKRPARLEAAIEKAPDEAALQRLLVTVATRSPQEIAEALHPPSPARRVARRRSR